MPEDLISGHSPLNRHRSGMDEPVP